MNPVQTDLFIFVGSVLVIFAVIYACFKLFAPKDPQDRRYIPVQTDGSGHADVPTMVPMIRPQYFTNKHTMKPGKDLQGSVEFKNLNNASPEPRIDGNASTIRITPE